LKNAQQIVARKARELNVCISWMVGVAMPAVRCNGPRQLEKAAEEEIALPSNARAFLACIRLGDQLGGSAEPNA